MIWCNSYGMNQFGYVVAVTAPTNDVIKSSNEIQTSKTQLLQHALIKQRSQSLMVVRRSRLTAIETRSFHQKSTRIATMLSYATLCFESKVIKSNLSLYSLIAVLRRSVEQVCGGPILQDCAYGENNSFWKNVTAVVSRWKHCVRFDWHEIWTFDIPL